MMTTPAEVYPHLYEDVCAASRVSVREGATGEPAQYMPFSVGDLGSYLPVELTREVKAGLVEKARPFLEDCDLIVTVIPGGHRWGLLVADAVGLPLVIVRKADDGLPEATMSRGLNVEGHPIVQPPSLRGRKALIVDDVVSGGSTIRFVTEAVGRLGVSVAGVVAILFKGDSLERVENEFGSLIYVLLRIDQGAISLDS